MTEGKIRKTGHGKGSRSSSVSSNTSSGTTSSSVILDPLSTGLEGGDPLSQIAAAAAAATGTTDPLSHLSEAAVSGIE